MFSNIIFPKISEDYRRFPIREDFEKDPMKFRSYINTFKCN